jgi:hypothetical protein
MNQAFDMKRLHMGCGESLQSHLPQRIYDKLPPTSRTEGASNRRGSTAASIKKHVRDESH